MDQTKKFFSLLLKLQPEQFIGVLRILSIPLTDENKNPRDFEEVYLDLATKWRNLPRERRRNLLRLLKQV